LSKVSASITSRPEADPNAPGPAGAVAVVKYQVTGAASAAPSAEAAAAEMVTSYVWALARAAVGSMVTRFAAAS
jgi:hypothetical protein